MTGGTGTSGGGGLNPGGHVYDIPAKLCFNHTAPDPAYSSSTPRIKLFNAATCYQASGGSCSSACDVNCSGSTDVTDVQLEVNQVLGVAPCTADINKDGVCNVIDVQRVVNAAMGGVCTTTP